MKWMTFLPILLAAHLLAPASGHGARIRVSQESRPGAGDFAQNVLGLIDSVNAKNIPAETYYAYSEIADWSYSGRQPRLRPDTSHLFFIRTKEGLTLFLVHDRAGNPDGGRASVRIDVEGDPNGLRILVRDDPYSASDSYDVKKGGRRITARHEWYVCCTDGLAAGALEGSWKVYVQFLADGTAAGRAAASTVRGLTTWRALSADNTEVRLHLKPGRRVLLEPMGFMVDASPASGLANIAPRAFVLRWPAAKR